MRKVIICWYGEPEEKALGFCPEITYLLRVEASGVETSGPTFFRFDEGTKVYAWSKVAAKVVNTHEPESAIEWLKKNGELLYPKPENKQPEPLTDQEFRKQATVLLQEAAEKLQHYCSEVNGDINDCLGDQISKFLADNQQS